MRYRVISRRPSDYLGREGDDSKEPNLREALAARARFVPQRPDAWAA
jgi:hypothetical protein